MLGGKAATLQRGGFRGAVMEVHKTAEGVRERESIRFLSRSLGADNTLLMGDAGRVEECAVLHASRGFENQSHGDGDSVVGSVILQTGGGLECQCQGSSDRWGGFMSTSQASPMVGQLGWRMPDQLGPPGPDLAGYISPFDYCCLLASTG